jgi:hypothetical protein
MSSNSGEHVGFSISQQKPVEELNKLASTLVRLYIDGFNVVPVDKDKRPLLSWS